MGLFFFYIPLIEVFATAGGLLASHSVTSIARLFSLAELFLF